jgi:hypothetical protein
MSESLSLDGFGSVFVELYVLPWEMPDANISLYGRGGTRICLLTDITDFQALPWLDRRLEGYIRCDRLKRTADKTAVVQDQVFRAFVARLNQLEPHIMELIDEISAESQERRFNIILGRVGRLIDKFLRYRERGLLEDLPFITATGIDRGNGSSEDKPERLLPVDPVRPRQAAVRVPSRAPAIRFLSPPKSKAVYRSWYEPDKGVICINREHTEFLLSQKEDRRCLRYLFSIWVKESLLQDYGDQAERVADEMVGVLAEAEPLLW